MEAPARTATDRERVILKFTTTAKRIALAWGADADSREEALSECYLKLIDVIDTAAPESLSEFYVSTALRNHLRDVHRRTIAGSRIPAEKIVFLSEPIGAVEDGEDMTYADVVADVSSPNPESVAVSKLWLHETLSVLPTRQRKVITRHLGLDGSDDCPMHEVAKCLRISRRTAFNDLSAAVATLRVELERQGFEAPASDSGFRELLRAA